MGLTHVEQGGMGDEIPQNMILMGLAHVEQGVWGMYPPRGTGGMGDVSPTWNRGYGGCIPHGG